MADMEWKWCLETAAGMRLDAIAVSIRQPPHGHAETDEAMRDRLRPEIAKLDNVRRISELVGAECALSGKDDPITGGADDETREIKP